MLPYGNGRSYGDSCLNAGGTLLATRRLDRFISFDPVSGIVECEAGVLLRDITELVLPKGWFLPVTPGTALVTVGGAIANDVHGKNHHSAGSFGNHVLQLRLLRSSGETLQCSLEENADWFRATIGGLGLTGLIITARVQLRRASSEWIEGNSHRFHNLSEFFALADASDRDYEYTVAWLDTTAQGKERGRGVFYRGNHAGDGPSAAPKRALRLPVTPPISLVNSWSLKAFNRLYFHRAAAQRDHLLWHYSAFFYPLDSVLEWNRMYGPRGFFQYQCVIPRADSEARLSEMLTLIARSGLGSFLVVLKTFGDIPARGMLSFARPGVTLALDFPNRGRATLDLLNALDQITRQAGGAVYPAKDARMSANSFRQYFPALPAFRRFVDPQFSSSFWRRVAGNTP